MAKKDNWISKLTEVFAKKSVEKNRTLDERCRGGVVYDVGDREVDAGRKRGISIFGLLSNFDETLDEKLRIAKAIRVEEGVVIGDGFRDSCRVSERGVSLFGFHADYFSKFETPGWYPKTRLGLAMTAVFAEAMIGSNAGKAWFERQRLYRWNSIKHGE